MNTLALLLLAGLAPLLAHDLTGRVLDAQSGEPIERARVTVEYANDGGESKVVSVLTGVEGGFAIRNVPDGRVTVFADRPGYLSGRATSIPKTLTAANEAKAFDLLLTRQAVIDVNITDPDGTPLTSIATLLKRQIRGNIEEFVPVHRGFFARRGDFRFHGLEAGVYLVRARGAAGPEGLAFPETYFPNADSRDGAEPIAVAAGEERRLHLVLTAKEAYEISGRWEHFDGGSGVHITLTRAATPEEHLDIGPGVQFSGRTFRLSGVTNGNYVVTVSKTEGDRTYRASQHVTVEDRGVEGLVFQLELAPPPKVITVDGPRAGR